MNLQAAKSKAGKPSYRELLLAFMYVFALYYLSYRYPFQIGSSSTSPTYSDTPLALQILKYLILLITTGLYLTFYFPNRFNIGRLSTILFLILYPPILSAFFIQYGGRLVTSFVEIAFSLLPALLFLSDDRGHQRAIQLSKHLVVFSVVTIAAVTLQMLLYELTGRLPGLGYEDGTVRYGGVWDDPNTASGIFAFVLPFIAIRYGARLFFFIFLAGAVYVSFMSAAMTASAALLGAMGIVFLVYVWKLVPGERAITSIATVTGSIVAAVLLIALAAAIFDDVSGRILRDLSEWYEAKEHSINAREKTYAVVDYITPATLIGLNPVQVTGENGILNIIANLGIPYMLVYLGFGLATIVRSLQKGVSTSNRVIRAVYFGFFGYLIWFHLTNLNIPTSEVFPVNLIMGVIAGIVWAPYPKKVAASSRSQRPLSALMTASPPAGRFGVVSSAIMAERRAQAAGVYASGTQASPAE